MTFDELMEAAVQVRELDHFLARSAGRTLTLEIAEIDGKVSIRSGDAWFHEASVEGLIFVLTRAS